MKVSELIGLLVNLAVVFGDREVRLQYPGDIHGQPADEPYAVEEEEYIFIPCPGVVEKDEG